MSLGGHLLRNALLPGYRLASLLRPGMRLSALLKEGNQCHEPAGSPEGGQFCGGSSDKGESSKPTTSTKAEADKIYNEKLNTALATLQAHATATTPGTGSNKAIIEFKTARAEAQAEWKASQSGTKAAPVPDQKIHAADAKMYDNLRSGADAKSAYNQWRQDTASEKAGTLGVKEQPAAAPKEPAAAPPLPTPVAVTPVGEIKPEPDIKGMSARAATHALLSTGRSYTVKELMERTKTNEANVRRYLSQMQNAKWSAATKDVLTLKREGDTYRLVGSRPPLTADERAALKGVKTEQAKVGTNEVSAKDFSETGKGRFAENNAKLNAMFMAANNTLNSGALKAQVSSQLATRLAEHEDWNRLLAAHEKAYPATKGFGNTAGERMTSAIIGRWAGTAGDSDTAAQAMQLAARDEFHMPDAKLGHMGIKAADQEEKIWNAAAHMAGFPEIKGGGGFGTGKVSEEDLATYKSAMRAFTRAEYENTQAFFKEKGITEVSVFRGMKQSVDSAPTVKTYQGAPLSSFSSRFETSRGFGSTIYMSTFPISHVVGTTLSGRGCLSEQELVILGHPIVSVRAGADNFSYGGSIDKVGTQAFKNMGKVHKATVDGLFDDVLENADWTKTVWDLPPYKSEEFNAIGFDLENFRKLPVYKHAVDAGLIVNDEWVGEKGMTPGKQFAARMRGRT